MNGLTRTIGTSAVGAIIMYLFDPARGRRRRAVMRDNATSASHEIGPGVTACDVMSRGQTVRSEGLAG